MTKGGFKYIKSLGWGGLGLVTLFEFVGENGQREKVVCKASLSKDDDALNHEKNMHMVRKSISIHEISLGLHADNVSLLQKVAGAKHIVQQIILRPPPGAESGLGEVTDRGREELDYEPGLLFIEYMPRGRLERYVSKAAKIGTPFPNLVLVSVG
jgi:hypothetical protein